MSVREFRLVQCGGCFFLCFKPDFLECGLAKRDRQLQSVVTGGFHIGRQKIAIRFVQRVNDDFEKVVVQIRHFGPQKVGEFFVVRMLSVD